MTPTDKKRNFFGWGISQRNENQATTKPTEHQTLSDRNESSIRKEQDHKLQSEGRETINSEQADE